MIKLNHLFMVIVGLLLITAGGCRKRSDPRLDYYIEIGEIEKEYFRKFDSLFDIFDKALYYPIVKYDSVEESLAPCIMKDSISLLVGGNQSVIVIQNNKVCFSEFLPSEGERSPYKIKFKRTDYLLVILDRQQTFYLDYRRYNTIWIKIYTSKETKVNYEQDNVYFH